MQLYKYLISIHESKFIREEHWVVDLIKTCGSYLLDQKQIGFYNFIDIQSIKRENKELYDSLLLNNKCPYIGKCVGVFTWEHFTKPEDMTYYITQLADVGGGIILNLDTKKHFEYVTEVTYPAEDIQSKYGFCDGAAILYHVRNKEEYDHYIKKTIINHLRSLNLQGTFINYGTSHNPVKICEEYSTEAYKGTSITFWGRNRHLEEDPNFIAFLGGE